MISNIRSSKKQFRASILKQVDEFCCSQIRAAALRWELRRGTKVLELSNLETLPTLLGKAIESKLIRKRAKQTNTQSQHLTPLFFRPYYSDKIATRLEAASDALHKRLVFCLLPLLWTSGSSSSYVRFKWYKSSNLNSSCNCNCEHPLHRSSDDNGHRNGRAVERQAARWARKLGKYRAREEGTKSSGNSRNECTKCTVNSSSPPPSTLGCCPGTYAQFILEGKRGVGGGVGSGYMVFLPRISTCIVAGYVSSNHAP